MAEIIAEIIGRMKNQADDAEATGTAETVSYAAVDVSDVTTPTDAELDSAFGTPAAVGAGFHAIVDDNDANTTVFAVYSNGTSWWYVALTKAT